MSVMTIFRVVETSTPRHPKSFEQKLLINKKKKDKPTRSLKQEKKTLQRLRVKDSPENEREFLFSVSFAQQLKKRGEL